MKTGLRNYLPTFSCLHYYEVNYRIAQCENMLRLRASSSLLSSYELPTIERGWCTRTVEQGFRRFNSNERVLLGRLAHNPEIKVIRFNEPQFSCGQTACPAEQIHGLENPNLNNNNLYLKGLRTMKSILQWQTMRAKLLRLTIQISATNSRFITVQSVL